MPKLGSWNETYDEKLLKLLNKGPLRGGIDSNNLSKEYIVGTVIEKFFPDRVYTSFSRLYCNKVNQFRINKTLRGGRKSEGKSNISLHAPNNLSKYLPLSFNLF